MHLAWRRQREGDLTPDDHVRLAATLRAAYPRFADRFTGTRSWLGARPEARLVADDDSGVAAHAGLVRRFVQVERDAAGHRAEQLVGIVGLVAVRPDLGGAGLGRTLMEHTAEFLRELRVPYGMLLCEDHVRGFYQACGWHPRPATSWALGFDPWDPAAHRASVPVMVLPVTAGLGEWPSGDLHWHCAQV